MVSENFVVDELQKTFGKGLEVEQLTIMAAFFCLWTSAYVISGKLLSYLDVQFARETDKKDLRTNIVSFLHAVISCSLSLMVVIFPDQAIIDNPYYGYSRRVMLACAISTSYFLWDVFVILLDSKIDFAFLFHGVACLLCYSFAQKPFMTKWACWFLLYELSTPFLNLRAFLLVMGKKDTEIYNYTQTLFGIAFVFVRIVCGVPISMYFVREMTGLLQDEKFFHNRAIAWYYYIACILLCLLNLYWFSFMAKKMLRPAKKQDQTF